VSKAVEKAREVKHALEKKANEKIFSLTVLRILFVDFFQKEGNDNRTGNTCFFKGRNNNISAKRSHESDSSYVVKKGTRSPPIVGKV